MGSPGAWPKATILKNEKKGRYDIALNFFPATQRINALEKEIEDLQAEFDENEEKIEEIEENIADLEELVVTPIKEKWLDAIKRAGIVLDLS